MADTSDTVDTSDTSDTEETSDTSVDDEIADGDGRVSTDDGSPKPPTAKDGPKSPTQLSKDSWYQILRRTGKQFSQDNLSIWAAALTYYGILSLFPALLVLISALRLTSRHTTQKVLDNLTSTAPGPTRSMLTSAITNLQHGQQSTAGVLAVIGVLTALWSASGYIGVFMQASNSIYDVPEGRSVWKKLPIRLGLTVVTGVIVVVSALAVVLTGGLARQVGKLLHIGSSVVTVWDIAKWPVLVLLVSLLFAILYWASPNAVHAGFRWITPGSTLAVLIWIVASAGFAVYATNFGSYNKTYGSLAAPIIFLVWLWITNLAILLGAEFDAEMQRGRAIAAGRAADDEPYMELRDTSKIDKNQQQDL